MNRLEGLQALRLALRSKIVLLPSHTGNIYGIESKNIYHVSVGVSAEFVSAFIIDEGWGNRSEISILIPHLIGGIDFFGILLRGNKKDANKLRTRAAKWLDKQIKLEKQA